MDQMNPVSTERSTGLFCVFAGYALCSWPANAVMWRRWSGQRGALGFPSWITGGRQVGTFLPILTQKSEPHAEKLKWSNLCSGFDIVDVKTVQTLDFLPCKCHVVLCSFNYITLSGQNCLTPQLGGLCLISCWKRFKDHKNSNSANCACFNFMWSCQRERNKNVLFALHHSSVYKSHNFKSSPFPSRSLSL